ncbi:MAG: hypothetical protein WC517_03615 [Patescibacteria group bacterium]
MVRKIGLGVGFWAVMFLAVSALMVTPLPAIWQRIFEIIVAGVAGYILAMIYFKKTPGDLKAGVILAVIWFVVSLVLDLLITIQYVKGTGSYMDGLKMFYSAKTFWVSTLAMVAGVLLAAKMTRGGQVMSRPQTEPMVPPPKPQM